MGVKLIKRKERKEEKKNNAYETNWTKSIDLLLLCGSKRKLIHWYNYAQFKCVHWWNWFSVSIAHFCCCCCCCSQLLYRTERYLFHIVPTTTGWLHSHSTTMILIFKNRDEQRHRNHKMQHTIQFSIECIQTVCLIRNAPRFIQTDQIENLTQKNPNLYLKYKIHLCLFNA